jgi:hypothetical protein
VKRPYEPWTTHEESVLSDLYRAGIDVHEISKEIPRHSPDACNRHALHMGIVRPRWYVVPRPNRTWDAIREVLASASEPLECEEIAFLADVHMSVVYDRLNERRGKLVHIADWRITTRKPAAKWVLGAGIDAPKPVKGKRVAQDANPFATAAGFVKPPAVGVGRIYRQPMSITDDDEVSA